MILTGIGRLGQDAVVRYTADNKPLMDISLAFNYGKKSDDKTQWINATMWGDRVEKVSQYMTKGTQLFVVLDDPHIEEYKRNDGSTGVSLRARVSSFEFVGGRGETKQEEKPAAPKDFKDMDDDIPF
jgi:single-strand DNA-binding protein